MLKLERRKPVKLIGLEALLRRLPETDESYEYYQELHAQVKKGYEGEMKSDREWKELVILLFKPWITKVEFSEFFNLRLKTSYRLIAKLPLEPVGVYKGHRYIIPENIWSHKIC